MHAHKLGAPADELQPEQRRLGHAAAQQLEPCRVQAVTCSLHSQRAGASLATCSYRASPCSESCSL